MLAKLNYAVLGELARQHDAAALALAISDRAAGPTSVADTAHDETAENTTKADHE